MVSATTLNVQKIAKLFIVSVTALVLMTQSVVQAQSVTMSTNELNALLAKVKTEVNRRITANEAAAKVLDDSTSSLVASAKKSVQDAVNKSQTALNDMLKQLDSTKDLKTAQTLATKVDTQYDQFASANASAFMIGDSDKQQQSVDQMKSLSKDAQSSIDQAGASGADASGQQDMMKTVAQLIQSIGSIVASVVALIVALATGNFTQAQSIFQTILGQLAQNLLSMGSAQGMLSTIVTSIGANGINVSPSYNTGS